MDTEAIDTDDVVRPFREFSYESVQKSHLVVYNTQFQSNDDLNKSVTHYAADNRKENGFLPNKTRYLLISFGNLFLCKRAAEC